MQSSSFVLSFFLVFFNAVVFGQTCPELLGTQLEGDGGFGRSIALSGDGMKLITGRPQSSNPGTWSGGATVFEFDNGDWEPLYGSFGYHDNGSRYGFDVDINGDGSRVILGGPRDPMPPPNGTGIGGARVYQLNGSSYSPLGDYLTGNTESGWFGHSVSMNNTGDIIAVGQPGSGAQIGETSAYQWDGVNWNQIGQSITGEIEDDLSGYHVCLSGSGTTLAIAEPKFTSTNGNDGRVRIFILEDDFWMLQGEIPSATEFIYPSLQEEETIQMQLSADGQHLVLGSPYYTEVPDLEYEGKVQVFSLENGSWAEDAVILGFGNLLGAAVTINATGNIITAADEYQIYTFQKVEGTWTKMGNSMVSYGDNMGLFDASMDASGSIFAKSIELNNNANSPISVYQWPCDYFPSCSVIGSCNYNNLATELDGSCDFNCLGCHDSMACNYDPTLEGTLFGPTVVLDFDNCSAPFDWVNLESDISCPDNWLGNYPVEFSGNIVHFLGGTCIMSPPNALRFGSSLTLSFPYPVTDLSFTYWTQNSLVGLASSEGLEVKINTEQDQITYSSLDTPWLFNVPNYCPGNTFYVPDIGIVSMQITCLAEALNPIAYLDDITFTYGTGCQYNECADPLACNFGNDCNGLPCDYLSCVGCLDSSACNYNELATTENGSCEYTTCAGCTESTACNYDETAALDDGSCEYLTCAGCTAPLACNFDPSATIDNGSCLFPDGCTDESACNYSISALCNDGSCEFTSCSGCTNPNACNFDPDATIEDASCEFESCTGCTDSDACNFEQNATTDDESCVYTSDLPTDISILENTLSAVYDPNFTYQWGECLPNGWAIIPGELLSDYSPEADGSYAVEIAFAEFGGCLVLTACTSISISHVAPPTESNSWKAWPNPTAGVLWIESPMRADGYSFTLRNQIGQIVLAQQNLVGATNAVKLELPNGLYHLHIHSEGSTVHAQTVVIER